MLPSSSVTPPTSPTDLLRYSFSGASAVQPKDKVRLPPIHSLLFQQQEVGHSKSMGTLTTLNSLPLQLPSPIQLPTPMSCAIPVGRSNSTPSILSTYQPQQQKITQMQRPSLGMLGQPGQPGQSGHPGQPALGQSLNPSLSQSLVSSPLSTAGPGSYSNYSTAATSPATSIETHADYVSSVPRMSKHLRKKRANLPKKTTAILLGWLTDNLDHPYPNSKEKADLIRLTGLTTQQLSNWFINARRRKIQMLRDIKNNTR